MRLPSPPRKGYPVEDTMREVINYLRAITINNVVGGMVKQSASGTTLEFRPGASFIPAATATKPPLILIAGSDNTKVQVTPGVVNFVSPTISGTALNNDPAPEITVTESTTYFWIKCVGVFGAPDTYTITIETTTTTSPPASAAVSSTGFTSCFYIGYVTFASGAITGIFNNYEGGNLGVESFGSVNLWWHQ